jgi:hypothetical protein
VEAQDAMTDAMSEKPTPDASGPPLVEVVESQGQIAPVDERPDEPAPAAAPDPDPLNLSLGIQIGALLALCLFAGMFSLLSSALRISATVFLGGVTLGVAGGMVTLLVSDAHRSDRAGQPDAGTSLSWVSVMEGTAVGLGILLGVLPVSLACSVLRESSMLPWVAYALSGLLLAGVGVVRAPSLRSLGSSVVYAILPGLAGLLVAHVIGDRLRALLTM